MQLIAIVIANRRSDKTRHFTGFDITAREPEEIHKALGPHVRDDGRTSFLSAVRAFDGGQDDSANGWHDGRFKHVDLQRPASLRNGIDNQVHPWPRAVIPDLMHLGVVKRP